MYIQRRTNDLRLGIVHNPTKVPDKQDTLSHFVSRAIQVAMDTLTPEVAKMFVPKLLKQENLEAIEHKERTLKDFETQVNRNLKHV